MALRALFILMHGSMSAQTAASVESLAARLVDAIDGDDVVAQMISGVCGMLGLDVMLQVLILKESLAAGFVRAHKRPFAGVATLVLGEAYRAVERFAAVGVLTDVFQRTLARRSRSEGSTSDRGFCHRCRFGWCCHGRNVLARGSVHRICNLVWDAIVLVGAAVCLTYQLTCLEQLLRLSSPSEE